MGARTLKCEHLGILALEGQRRVGRVKVGICGRINRRTACGVNGVGVGARTASAVLRVGLTFL